MSDVLRVSAIILLMLICVFGLITVGPILPHYYQWLDYKASTWFPVPK